MVCGVTATLNADHALELGAPVFGALPTTTDPVFFRLWNGLRDIADQPSGALPLGLRQRLSLACALLHEPPLLFLDEPTSGVDPVTRREFWSHINALADHGVTVLVTTHFMDEAEYCDRIALIYRGRLLALGTPDELKGLAAKDTSTALPTMEEAFITLVEQASEEDA